MILAFFSTKKIKRAKCAKNEAPMILQGQFPVQLLLVCVFLNVRTRKKS